jgi:hypothetical protein
MSRIRLTVCGLVGQALDRDARVVGPDLTLDHRGEMRREAAEERAHLADSSGPDLVGHRASAIAVGAQADRTRLALTD